MATPHYVVQKVGAKYVTVPANSHPAATKATYVIWGGLLTLAGLRRRSLPGLVIAGLGGWMAWSALNGRNPSISSLCSKLSAFRFDFGDEQGPSFQHDHGVRPTQKPQDAVDEASMESFPASDPPAKMAASSNAAR